MLGKTFGLICSESLLPGCNPLPSCLCRYIIHTHIQGRKASSMCNKGMPWDKCDMISSAITQAYHPTDPCACQIHSPIPSEPAHGYQCGLYVAHSNRSTAVRRCRHLPPEQQGNFCQSLQVRNRQIFTDERHHEPQQTRRAQGFWRSLQQLLRR